MLPPRTGDVCAPLKLPNSPERSEGFLPAASAAQRVSIVHSRGSNEKWRQQTSNGALVFHSHRLQQRMSDYFQTTWSLNHGIETYEVGGAASIVCRPISRNGALECHQNMETIGKIDTGSIVVWPRFVVNRPRAHSMHQDSEAWWIAPLGRSRARTQLAAHEHLRRRAICAGRERSCPRNHHQL